MVDRGNYFYSRANVNSDEEDKDESYANSDLPSHQCLFSSCGGPASLKLEDKIHNFASQVADACGDNLSTLGGQLCPHMEGEKSKYLKKEVEARIGAAIIREKKKERNIYDRDKEEISSFNCGHLYHAQHNGQPLHLTNIEDKSKGVEAYIDTFNKLDRDKEESSSGGATSLKIEDDTLQTNKELHSCSNEAVHSTIGCPFQGSNISNLEDKNKGVGPNSGGDEPDKAKKNILHSSDLLNTPTPWIIRHLRKNKRNLIPTRRAIRGEFKHTENNIDPQRPATPKEDFIVDEKIHISSRKTLHFVPPEKQNGIPIVKPTKDIMEEGSQRWSATAIGHFVGKKPYFHKLNSFVRSKWKGIKEVIAAKNGFFLFVFKNEVDLEFVIEGGPQFFNGQPIFLQKWQPGMSMEKPRHQHIPVWIKLRNLPLEYWTLDGLSVVASGVGQPLYPDQVTRSCSRVDFARVCVLIDTAAQLPKNIVLIKPTVNGSKGGTCKVYVEYEWLPPKSSSSSGKGHETIACNNRAKTIQPQGSGLRVYIRKVHTSIKENAAGNIGGKKKEVKRMDELKQTNKGAITHPSHRTQSVWLPKKSPGTRPGITPASKPSSIDEPSSNLSPKKEDRRFSSNIPKGTRPTTRPCSQPCSPRVQYSNGDFCNDNPRGTRPRTRPCSRPCSSWVQIEGRGKEIAIFNPFSVLDLNDADTNADIDADAQMED